jgi:hypothetical protein
MDEMVNLLALPCNNAMKIVCYFTRNNTTDLGCNPLKTGISPDEVFFRHTEFTFQYASMRSIIDKFLTRYQELSK